MDQYDKAKMVRDIGNLINPKQDAVIQLRSDFWIIFDHGLWREMTDEEVRAYD